jgi:hypothetical protein
MHPLTTNISAQTFDVHRFSFESATMYISVSPLEKCARAKMLLFGEVWGVKPKSMVQVAFTELDC